MNIDSIHFKGHSCFKKEWAGFDTIEPINVIIGRNNSGKSHLLDLAEALCVGIHNGQGWQYRCSGVLDEESLRGTFSVSKSGVGGGMRGNHWSNHGRHFVDIPITWEVGANGDISNEVFPDGFKSDFPYGEVPNFEELENNLHPAILRRLFRYIEEYAINEKTHIFLTTHSSTALDLFGVSKDAQIIHVLHDGESARTIPVSAHFDHLRVVSKLGAKPSDLLQANGIIWVEGPSDRIYLNCWIDLYSEGRFQEGRDYQCVSYGGSLLARTQFKSPEEAEADLVNLIQVNPNIIVVCDGDRTTKDSDIKGRVKRIHTEVQNIPDAHIWITDAKEIENYIPGSVLEKALDRSGLRDPEQYENFFPRKKACSKSYIEANLNRGNVDKVDLAMASIPHMTNDIMADRFDWEEQMKEIVARIESWNT